ncbi:MAG: hypothetical protein PVH31_04000 [Ectothiorhodospiraceae bacterium]|jgi:hypothetical protein
MVPFRMFLLATGTALATGCATLVGPAPHTVPEGSRLTLEQPIELPAGRFSIWIQNSRYDMRSVNEYKPFCALKGTADAAGSYGPAELRITQVNYRYDGHTSTPGSWQVASLTQFNTGDTSELTMFQTWMQVSADGPSPIAEVVCSRRDYASRGRFVSVEDIRRTLAPYFSLELAGE